MGHEPTMRHIRGDGSLSPESFRQGRLSSNAIASHHAKDLRR
jgi:hypothetical protein